MKKVKTTEDIQKEEAEREIKTAIKAHTAEIKKLLQNIRTVNHNKKLTGHKNPYLDNMIKLYLGHKKKINALNDEYLKLMQFQQPVQSNRPLNIAPFTRVNLEAKVVSDAKKLELELEAKDKNFIKNMYTVKDIFLICLSKF